MVNSAPQTNMIAPTDLLVGERGDPHRVSPGAGSKG